MRVLLVDLFCLDIYNCTIVVYNVSYVFLFLVLAFSKNINALTESEYYIPMNTTSKSVNVSVGKWFILSNVETGTTSWRQISSVRPSVGENSHKLLFSCIAT